MAMRRVCVLSVILSCSCGSLLSQWGFPVPFRLMRWVGPEPSLLGSTLASRVTVLAEPRRYTTTVGCGCSDSALGEPALFAIRGPLQM